MQNHATEHHLTGTVHENKNAATALQPYCKLPTTKPNNHQNTLRLYQSDFATKKVEPLRSTNDQSACAPPLSPPSKAGQNDPETSETSGLACLSLAMNHIKDMAMAMAQRGYLKHPIV